MEHNIVKEVCTYLSRVREETYEQQGLSREYFKKLPESHQGRIAFLDGSNYELFGGSGFSVSILRICILVYDGMRRDQNIEGEYYLLIKIEKGVFVVTFFPLGNTIPLSMKSISLTERTLQSGEKEVTAQKVAEQARRHMELCYLKSYGSLLQKGDLLVLDGSIDALAVQEGEALLQAQEQKEVIICGLSKTNRMLTQEGKSVQAILEKLSPYATWYYPLPSKHTKLYLIKLHEKSKYVFKIEFFKHGLDSEEIFSRLRIHAQDPLFLGYPYGLIAADKQVRITKEEAQSLQSKFKLLFSDSWKEVETHTSSITAHTILDSI